MGLIRVFAEYTMTLIFIVSSWSDVMLLFCFFAETFLIAGSHVIRI